jgi:hypothetical protein
MLSCFRRLHLAFALAALLPSTSALAWGDQGHMTIALIARQFLNPQARATVDAMLASDPDRLTGPDMASKAMWADKYRDSVRGQSFASTGTEKWHFTNIELDRGDANSACFGHPALPAGTPASQGPASSCSIDKVEQFAAELENAATPAAERLMALKYLLHLVGDLHQPLHSSDNHDGGGNGVFIVAGRSSYPIKLHAYWDTEVVKAMGGNPASLAASISAEYGPRWREWTAGRPQDWALDAFNKARTVAYALPQRAGTDGSGRPVYRIDAAYERTATAAAREQMAKAGIRLAGLLNGAFRER